MTAAVPTVKCSVSNCVYWKEGDDCGADAILITTDRHANRKEDVEFAGDTYRVVYEDAAQTSSQTCCRTFRRKPYE